ncbi:hypothetical protein SAMN04490248_11157 [Salinihabitans flavidus]|uniref:4-hydroxythreonine-4-phosphate dehydrogenase n=1 Tax=Salinihabitans flavidus TaxID=569882 RepID=A0A1H8SA32_9RHOB|nr:4-hydroxythreonine-4-phosphate dehydrogenase [Salinihabitans flavidus]SEO75224.1 hypothetical protein SAMN04490248_11157 [Salinihabitans flavidus]
MPFDFIFMLTRNDRTVTDAALHLETALAAGVTHIGVKDTGLPEADLAALIRVIRQAGATAYLEVVSPGLEAEVKSARAALRVGVDVLLGGTHAAQVAALLRGHGLRYYPFAGRVSGHPSVLHGPAEHIRHSARTLCAVEGVDGIDLLAYRNDGDAAALMRSVCESVNKPVIMAGSIDRPDRIAAARAAGAAGFTIGTAALDGAFPAPGRDLPTQLAAIQAAARGA